MSCVIEQIEVRLDLLNMSLSLICWAFARLLADLGTLGVHHVCRSCILSIYMSVGMSVSNTFNLICSCVSVVCMSHEFRRLIVCTL